MEKKGLGFRVACGIWSLGVSMHSLGVVVDEYYLHGALLKSVNVFPTVGYPDPLSGLGGLISPPIYSGLSGH